MQRRWSLPLGLALVAGFAAIAALSGLDRIGAQRASIAPLVPEPFRVFSARALATAEITAGRPEQALPEARLAILGDPVDARSSALLAAGRLGRGDRAGARQAFAVSGFMGWREPMTQIYWMGEALNQGDYRVASQRLDAVLRQAVYFPQRDALLEELELAPSGRLEIARRLADAPEWRDSYFVEAFMLQPDAIARRAAVAELLARPVGLRNCKLVAPLTKLLAEHSDYAGASQVWRAHCAAPNAPAGIVDGGFEVANLASQGTAFDWRWSDNGAIDLLLAPAPGFSGKALNLTSTASLATVFANQLTALPAGTYRLRWRALTQAGQPAAAVFASLACDQESRSPLAATLVDRRSGRFEAEFTVPAGCPAQWLRFAIGPGGGSLVFDDVGIVRQ